MQEAYSKAIQRIKKLDKIVTIKEWNQIAKEENLLSAWSIEYISQMDFTALQREVRAS